LHRDLKPRNLLVNSNCDLKICDFGLARAHGAELKQKSCVMTDYVATRWYRAPELLLAYKEYDSSVDMWSVGCILAELLRRKPFLPGTSTPNQLELIFDVMGTPSEEDIGNVPRERSKKLLRNMIKKKPKPFEVIFSNANPKALDLLKKLLVFDPKKRIKVEEALKHPYLATLHYPDDEPIRDPVPKAEFEFERYPLTLEQTRDLLYEETLLYHFPEFRTEYERKIAAKEDPSKHILFNDNALKAGDRESDEEDGEYEY